MRHIALLGIIVFVCAGCQNKLHDENTRLWQQNRELQAELERKGAELSQRPDANQVMAMQQGMQQELAARDAKIAELENQLRQPTPGAGEQPGIEGIETSYDAARGEMTVNLPGDILFDSGQDRLKPSAAATLDKIARALRRDYAGKPVRVEGHTDSDPITRSKDRYIDNLDLSLNRAAAVARHLEGEGLDPRLITTSGFGEHHPRGGSKSKNRRVEIVVVVR